MARSRKPAAARQGAGTAAVAAALDAAATARFERLREWRREVARERGVPPYVIFHDRTLAQIAELAPDDLRALAEVPGVGEKKLADWGAALLDVVGA